MSVAFAQAASMDGAQVEVALVATEFAGHGALPRDRLGHKQRRLQRAKTLAELKLQMAALKSENAQLRSVVDRLVNVKLDEQALLTRGRQLLEGLAVHGLGEIVAGTHAQNSGAKIQTMRRLVRPETRCNPQAIKSQGDLARQGTVAELRAELIGSSRSGCEVGGSLVDDMKPDSLPDHTVSDFPATDPLEEKHDEQDHGQEQQNIMCEDVKEVDRFDIYSDTEDSTADESGSASCLVRSNDINVQTE